MLQNVANRKRSKQLETGGLVITKAIYGSVQALKKNRNESEETKDDIASQVADVTLPLNFLVTESGQLKVCSPTRYLTLMIIGNIHNQFNLIQRILLLM